MIITLEDIKIAQSNLAVMIAKFEEAQRYTVLPVPAARIEMRPGDCHTGADKDMGKPMCRMRCVRCGAETDWLVFQTVTEAKRGIPCEACNPPTRA